MVIPSPGERPKTGYFAATTKPCGRGLACTKLGCTFSHPAGRAKPCLEGASCAVVGCLQLHPIDGLAAGGEPGTVYAVGEGVEARYLPNSARWAKAVVRRIRGNVLTLQFDGYSDVHDVPARRIRKAGRPSPDTVAASPASALETKQQDQPCSAPPGFGPTRSPPGLSAPTGFSLAPPNAGADSSDVPTLEKLKHAAVLREDYVEAQRLKQRIALVKEVATLTLQKQVAVKAENFLHAMQLKQRIEELQRQQVPVSMTKKTQAPAVVHRKTAAAAPQAAVTPQEQHLHQSYSPAPTTYPHHQHLSLFSTPVGLSVRC